MIIINHDDYYFCAYKLYFNMSKENNKDKVEIVYELSLSQSKDLYNWIADEDLSCFADKLNMIIDHAKKGELLILLHNKYPVGYASIRIESKYIAKIVLAEIHPQYRGKGYGRLLVDHILSLYKKKGCLVVEIESKNHDSDTFGTKMNFVDFPTNFRTKRKTMYHILISNLEYATSINDADEVIKLWDSGVIRSNTPANWIWKIEYKDNSNLLKTPIIHPAHFDWKIQWSNGNEIFQNTIMKNFDSPPIEFGNYIIISELHKE